MNYIEALIDAAQPDAPASAVADLLTMAQAEGIATADAIADRRGLQAVLSAPTQDAIEAADAADAEASEAVRTAKTKTEVAQAALDAAEVEYVAAHQQATNLAHRKADADRALKRSAVISATQSKDSR